MLLLCVINKIYQPTQGQHSVYNLDKHSWQSLQHVQFFKLVISQSHDLINKHLLTILTQSPSLQHTVTVPQNASTDAQAKNILFFIFYLKWDVVKKIQLIYTVYMKMYSMDRYCFSQDWDGRVREHLSILYSIVILEFLSYIISFKNLIKKK